jgi:hypothetical protein
LIGAAIGLVITIAIDVPNEVVNDLPIGMFIELDMDCSNALLVDAPIVIFIGAT